MGHYRRAINTIIKGQGIYADPNKILKFDVSKRINKSQEFNQFFIEK